MCRQLVVIIKAECCEDGDDTVITGPLPASHPRPSGVPTQHQPPAELTAANMMQLTQSAHRRFFSEEEDLLKDFFCTFYFLIVRSSPH